MKTVITAIISASILLVAAGFIAQKNVPSPSQPIPDDTIRSNRPHFVITASQDGMVMGEIEIELYVDLAPKHSINFAELVGRGFYDGVAFHRVIPGFMIQGGDPNSKSKPRESWGMGDTSLKTVDAEFSTTLKHKRGTVSAARTNDPNSASSQFFICHAPAPSLDGKYSIFGETVRGLDVVDKIANAKKDSRDNPLSKISMTIKGIPPAKK